MITIRDGDLRREVLVVAYVQSAGGARLIVDEWPFDSFTFTAADDRGLSYQISWRRRDGTARAAAAPGPAAPDPLA